MNNLLELVIRASQQAGAAAMRYCQLALTVERMQDGSPLTLAVQEAYRVIAR